MKRIACILRAGIGDAAIFFMKFKALKELHKQDQLIGYIISPIPEVIKDLLILYPIFDEVHVLTPYNGVVTDSHLKQVGSYDKLYIFNLWTGTCVVPLDTLYPELKIEAFCSFENLPKIETPKNLITIQMYGKSSPCNWALANWRNLTQELVRKEYTVAILGDNYNESFVGMEHCINLNTKLNIKETASWILASKLFIGKDSGLKNLAFLSTIPAIVIRDPLHKNANPLEAWIPLYYQQNKRNAIFDINTVAYETVLNKALEVLKM